MSNKFYNRKSNRGFTVTTDRDGSRSFGEHDDRWQSGRRPNYRGGGGRGRSYRGGNKHYQAYRGPNPRSRLDNDGDEDMNDGPTHTNRRRFNPYGNNNRKDRFRGKDDRNYTYGKVGDAAKRLGLPFNDRRERDPEKEWFKVIIPHGKNYEKKFILQTITDHSEVPFIPYCFQKIHHQAVFYTQGRKCADAIRSVNRKVTLPNGFKLMIEVRSGEPPVRTLSVEEVLKLKAAMEKRYDSSIRLLNLSSLYTDEGLRQDSLYIALNKPQIMNVVIKIIEENIPDLSALDLSDNKLMRLDHLVDLVEKAPAIKCLNLEKNNLRSVEELDKIKKWQLEEIILDGNNLCDRFTEEHAYISAVRKRFPKCMKLDRNDLPPPISFDIEAGSSLPPSAGSHFLNEEIQTLLVGFLKQYYAVYDAESRQNLLEAYHDKAIFSMAATMNNSMGYNNQSRITEYIEKSRNLVRVKEYGRRQKLIKHGKLSIVSELCQLPKTVHDPSSFKVDVTSAQPSYLNFTVSGVFKEAESRSDKPPIRAFSRVFVTVPFGTGMAITNDTMLITNATSEQMQAAFKNLAPTPSSSPVLATASSLLSGGEGLSVVQDDKQKMIQQFSMQTGMNDEWSLKCLEQNGMSFEQSWKNFSELQAQGKIPPDAFKK